MPPEGITPGILNVRGVRAGCGKQFEILLLIQFAGPDGSLHTDRRAAEGRLKRITGCGTFVCSGSEIKRICVVDPPVGDPLQPADKYRIMDSESLIYYENTYPIIDSEFLKYAQSSNSSPL